MLRARDGAPSRLWIVAERQTAGRGRLARSWSSPPGNLYASLLLRNETQPVRAAELGFVAGLALHEAVAPLLPLPDSVRLKWPNDLMIGDAKVAGILLEGSALADGTYACVIGWGVNCVSHPQAMAYPVTDLAQAGASAGPWPVFERLSEAFARWFVLWRQPDGFQAVRCAWLAQAYRIGETISLAQAENRIEGRFRTIDETGRLVLEQDGRQTIIDTGDVMPPAARRSSRKAG